MTRGAQETRVGNLMKLVAEARELLDRARVTADWNDIVLRETRLREQIESLLATPVGMDEAAAVRIALEEFLALNHKMTVLVDARMSEVVASMQHVVTVRKAAEAYGSASRV